MNALSIHNIFRQLKAAADDTSLLAMTQACRASNLKALDCAPELYLLFPSTGASALAAALVATWSCELSAATLGAALTSCAQAGGAPAYTAAQVGQAVADNISLSLLSHANLPTPYGVGINRELKMIGLSQGDLMQVKPAESARFLIISCLPGDYTPTPGSLILALKTDYGIDLAALATNKAADYTGNFHCWFSQPLSSNGSKPFPYQQLLVFESTGEAAALNLAGVFSAIKAYLPAPPPLPETGATIVSAMLSTGGAGAAPAAVLTALFNGCWDLMTAGAGYNLTCFRIVSFQPAWSAALTSTFDALYQQHQS